MALVSPPKPVPSTSERCVFDCRTTSASTAPFVAEQPAPAPQPAPANPEACAALRSVLVTAPRVSLSCEHLPDGFHAHLASIFRMIPSTPL